MTQFRSLGEIDYKCQADGRAIRKTRRKLPKLGAEENAELLPNWRRWRLKPLWSANEFVALVWAPVVLRLTARPLPDLLKTHVDGGVRDDVARAIAAGWVRDLAPRADWLRVGKRLGWSVPAELLSKAKAPRPARASDAALGAFLARPEIAKLTRPKQTAAARAHFAPAALPDRQLRKAFSQEGGRTAGRRTK
jgi:hypothetical protein